MREPFLSELCKKINDGVIFGRNSTIQMPFLLPNFFHFPCYKRNTKNPTKYFYSFFILRVGGVYDFLHNTVFVHWHYYYFFWNRKWKSLKGKTIDTCRCRYTYTKKDVDMYDLMVLELPYLQFSESHNF